ncbi:hypothetical protein [Photobacterium leiognathi]|uniref:hypothetical protein n=1 Tax=Photobacterium leiognathi TaxID=553611 RepID=UPI002981CD27|nr:hypothetical protein [Photobacterium leiognathi]
MKVLGLVLVGVAFGVATLISTSNAIPNLVDWVKQDIASPLVAEKCIENLEYSAKIGYKDSDKLAQYQADCDEEIEKLKRMKVVADALTGDHKG